MLKDLAAVAVAAVVLLAVVAVAAVAVSVAVFVAVVCGSFQLLRKDLAAIAVTVVVVAVVAAYCCKPNPPTGCYLNWLLVVICIGYRLFFSA